MSADERQWGVLSHILPLFATFVLGGFGWLVALVIYLTKKETSKFVAFHSLQEVYLSSINFGLIIVSTVCAITIILLPIALVIWIGLIYTTVVLPIIGAIRANNGETFRLPIVGDWAANTTGV